MGQMSKEGGVRVQLTMDSLQEGYDDLGRACGMRGDCKTISTSMSPEAMFTPSLLYP